MLHFSFCFVFAARNSPPSDTSRGGQTTKPLQTKGRQMKGRPMKGRPMKGRQVKGRQVKGRQVKSQSYTIGLFRNAALAIFASN
jgi:hypothetical protein